MIIQIVRYHTGLSHDEVDRRFRDRSARYREVSGLLQKFYMRFNETDEYGGIYVWDSRESLEKWKAGDLAGTLSETYEIIGDASREIAEIMLVLHPEQLRPAGSTG